MATLKQRPDAPGSWFIRFYVDGLDKRLHLGQMSKRNRNIALTRVEDLVESRKLGSAPSAETVQWLEVQPPNIVESLDRLGLMQYVPADKSGIQTLEAYLDEFCGEFIGKAETRTNYRQTASWLLDYFDGSTLLSRITDHELEQWGRFLKQKDLAFETRRKHIQRCRRMFKDAVKARLLTRSPAEGLKMEKQHSRGGNPKRFFVTPEITTQVMCSFANDQWRLLFALMRYAGMRRHEVLSFSVRGEWLIIDSDKTGYRECPLFPEIRPWIAAAPIRCVSDADSITPLLIKRIKRALGYCWPAVCINLRSTRRTELEERFPPHVIDEWLGHDYSTAKKHYLQVTDEHKRKALDADWNGNWNATGSLEASNAVSENTESPGNSLISKASDDSQVTPMGPRTLRIFRGNQADSA